MRQDDAVEGDRAEALGTLVVAFLGCGQQRVQHLDRRLEHLDELKQPAVGQAQPAGIRVSVRIVLREIFQLPDIYLADQRGDVLVVFIARLRLGNRDLRQHRRAQLDHAKARDVAVELMQALDRPRRGDGVEITHRDAVVLFQDLAVFLGGEQPERRFMDRRTLQCVDGNLLHQRLELFRERGLATTRRPKQVKDLLALLEPLRGMLEEGDDLLDRVLHAVELAEGRIDPDDLVEKQAGQPRIVVGIHQFGLTNGGEHALGCGRIGGRILLADIQVLLDAVFLFLATFEACGVVAENVHTSLPSETRPRRR